ncbi:hypothetical protein ACWCP6_04600 [Streptomyces sp. NPDC002004]
MYRVGVGSPRAWLVLAVLLSLLFALLVLRLPAFAGPGYGLLRAIPTGGSRGCGADVPARPEPLGEGERDEVPALRIRSYGYYDPGPKLHGRPRFTLSATVEAGEAPLLLTAPVAEHRVTVDVFGPHGEGRTAKARGLTATVVSGPAGKRMPTPTSGSFRAARERDLYLEVELPPGAVCPGHSLTDVTTCSPADTNQVEDCPVVTLTLADPAIRAYRADRRSQPAGTLSDRLVAVSWEPDLSNT